jgi:transposase
MDNKLFIKGLKNRDFPIDTNDKTAMKFAMLIEGQCTIGVQKAIKKYGYTEQRYYQLLKLYREKGLDALIDKKRGSSKQPVRTKEAVNQIIRLRFLDPFASTSVIAQKMRQMGYKVSQRSVERTITDYGLKKKLIR